MATAYRWSGEIDDRAGWRRAEVRTGATEEPKSSSFTGPGIRQMGSFCADRRAASSRQVSSLTTRSLRRELMVGNCRKPAAVEFYTVKRIDNSRLVRHMEPAKMRNLLRTAALGGIIAVFFMLYVYQHFRCIDMSFQLEDLKGKQAQAAELNGKLKLEIATLRDPHRIDVIAQRQLGFKRPEANQVREYVNLDGAEVAALQYTRLSRAP